MAIDIRVCEECPDCGGTSWIEGAECLYCGRSRRPDPLRDELSWAEKDYLMRVFSRMVGRYGYR